MTVLGEGVGLRNITEIKGDIFYFYSRIFFFFFFFFFFCDVALLAFFINLQRVVGGPSGQLTGR